MTSKPVKAWWFSATKTLPHDDGRRIATGRTHKVRGEIVPCRNGLHGSIRAIDALRYAPGTIIWRVELSGVVVPHGGDKFVAAAEQFRAEVRAAGVFGVAWMAKTK